MRELTCFRQEMFAEVFGLLSAIKGIDGESELLISQFSSPSLVTKNGSHRDP